MSYSIFILSQEASWFHPHDHSADLGNSIKLRKGKAKNPPEYWTGVQKP